jgi:hypothetical protein
MERGQRIAERHPFEPADRRNERRLVHKTPGEMMAAGQVIQLVDKISVTAADQHVRGEDNKRQPAQ